MATGDELITRFKENEERFDKFTNALGTFTASTGELVETLRSFLARKDAEINTASGSLLQNVEAIQTDVEQIQTAIADVATATTAARDVALAAKNAAISALSAASLPTTLIASRYLAVNSSGTGYELRAPATDYSNFYGLRLSNGSLLLDTGAGNYNDADYAASMIAPAGISFAITATGNLTLTF